LIVRAPYLRNDPETSVINPTVLPGRSIYRSTITAPPVTSCSSSIPLQFQLALDRAEAQGGQYTQRSRRAPDHVRNMQAQVEQAQKDVDFNMVNFQRQEQLIANNLHQRHL